VGGKEEGMEREGRGEEVEGPARKYFGLDQPLHIPPKDAPPSIFHAAHAAAEAAISWTGMI